MELMPALVREDAEVSLDYGNSRLLLGYANSEPGSSVLIEDESENDLELGIATSNLTLRADNERTNKVHYYCNQSIATLRLMDELVKVLQRQLCVSDAKLLMFASAAHSEGYRSTLVPVPTLFMREGFYDIERLRRIVCAWPSCRCMLDMLSDANRYSRLAETGGGDIHLLHWVLVWQAYPDLRRICSRRLQRLCRKYHLQRPTLSPGHLLRVTYKGEPSVDKPNCRHAYLGSPLHMLYRLLIMRDMPSPLQLYEHPEAALAQCTGPPCNGWPHSQLGRAPRCLIICELLEYDLLHSKNQTQAEFGVRDPSGLRMRYLLIFTDVTKVIGFLPSLAGRTDSIISSDAATEIRTSPGAEIRANTPSTGGSNRGLFGLARWLVRHALRLVKRQPVVYY